MHQLIHIIDIIINRYNVMSQNILALFAFAAVTFFLVFYTLYKFATIIYKSKIKKQSELVYLKYSLPGDNRKEVNKK